MASAYDPQALCMALLHADAGSDVIAILQSAELWDDPTAWRDLGDEPENYSTVGNQQSRAEQALVEKLVNAMDTKLIAACRQAGIDPTAPTAPQTMAKAREQFFGDQTQIAPSITVAATGARSPKNMSLSIADDGEGQTPSASLLVFVDCSALSPRSRELLFMPSRDRLRDSEFRREVEQALEDKLRNHPKLKEIATARRDRERANAPEISESFKRFLEEMLKRHPQLAGVLGPGLQIRESP